MYIAILKKNTYTIIDLTTNYYTITVKKYIKYKYNHKLYNIKRYLIKMICIRLVNIVFFFNPNRFHGIGILYDMYMLQYNIKCDMICIRCWITKHTDMR